MRLAGIVAAVLAVLALPSLAAARPFYAGASFGRIQSKANAEGDASDTVQLFGRVGLTNRLGLQVELQKIEDPGVDVRGGTALLVVELANNPHWAPILVAGFGIDKASSDYYDASGTHTEGGIGLEYRADGGFTIGADVRMGGRSVDENSYCADCLYPQEGDILLYPAAGLVEGEYRSARLYAAIRF